MAEISLLHFRQGNTFIHKLDPYIKFVIMIMFSIVLFRANTLFLSINAEYCVIILFIAIIFTPGLSIKAVFKSFRYILFASLFIITLKSLYGGGEKYLRVFSIAGTIGGLIYSLRLFLLLLFSQLFAMTTDPHDLQEGIYKTQRPIAKSFAGRLATMISLTITFIPLIFD